MDPRKNRNVFKGRAEIGLGHGLEFPSIHGSVVRASDAKGPGDGQSGALVIAGHHDHADAGPAAFCHSCRCFLARWVHLSGQAKENRMSRESGETLIFINGNPTAFRHGEHPERLGTERISRRHGCGPCGISEGKRGSIIHPDESAEGEHLFRRTLDDNPRRVPMLRRHEACGGIERNFPGARMGTAQFAWIDACLPCGCQQSCLGRITQRPPSGVHTIRRDQLRVIAQHHRFQHLPQGCIGRVRWTTSLDQTSLGQIATPGNANPPSPGQPERRHRHLIARQRPRLVGTDHIDRTERLHSREAPDHGSFTGHPLHAHCQRYRHGHRQPFRHHADHLTDAHHEDFEKRQTTQQTDRNDDTEENDRSRGQPLPEGPDALFQWRDGFLRGSGETGNAADFRMHSRGGHDGAAAACGYMSSGVQHAMTIGQRGIVRDWLGVLHDRQ